MRGYWGWSEDWRVEGWQVARLSTLATARHSRRIKQGEISIMQLTSLSVYSLTGWFTVLIARVHALPPVCEHVYAIGTVEILAAYLVRFNH